MKNHRRLGVLLCTLPALGLASLPLSQAQAAETFTASVLETAPEKAQTCFGCHGSDGQGLSREYPNLAGQSQYYMEKQLRAFRSGERSDPTMNAMAASLSDQDIEVLSSWYASLSPVPQAASEPKAPGAMKVNSAHFPAPVYVTFKGDGAMGSLPDNSHWPGGENMLYDSLSADGKTLVATSPSTNSLYVFDALTGKQRAVIPVGKVPKGVKISPNGHTVYVSDEGGATVSVVDLKQMQLITTIEVEQTPHNVRFNNDGSLAYVTLQGGAGLGVINAREHSLEKIIPVPGITGPHNIDLSADGKTAWIRDFVHNVAVLDLESEQVTQVIKVGNGHGGIDIAPNGSFVATAAIGSDIITVIDPVTFESTDIKVGKGPHGVRASKDSRWIYVSVTQENKIVVVDAKTLEVVEKIDVGAVPFWIALEGNN